MRCPPMVLVTIVGAALAGCVDAASGGPVPAPPGRADPDRQENAVPVRPIDQPNPQGPPISRERSPVLDQALAANSSAALIVFLLRHPDDAFAEQARGYLRLRHTPDSAAALQTAAGPEAAVVGAFDAARLAGTDAAWADFLARFGGHALAAEVPRFR